jgi:hypothetical protein
LGSRRLALVQFLLHLLQLLVAALNLLAQLPDLLLLSINRLFQLIQLICEGRIGPGGRCPSPGSRSSSRGRALLTLRRRCPEHKRKRQSRDSLHFSLS